MRRRILQLGALLTLGLSVVVARATSLPPDFLSLSQYESVKEAEDVLLGVPIAVRTDGDERDVRFRIERSLKGKEHGPTVLVPVEFHYRPVGGQTRVLFVRRQSRLSRLPLSRQVWPPTSAPLTVTALLNRPAQPSWVEILEQYAKIAALNDYEKEKAALRELQRNAPPGLASDIELHFQTPSPHKSFEDLAELHRLSPTQAQKDKVLNAMAQALHPQAFDLIEPHLQHRVLRVRFLDYLTKVDHPRRQQVLLREFEGSTDQLEREALARALVSRASKADQPAMLRALRACEDDEFSGAIICGWFVRNPMPEATALMKERMGQDFSRSTRFLFSVAMLGDEDVVRWAERGMREEDTRVGAVYALAYSPTAAADSIVRKIIAGRDMECLPLLVYALAQDGDHSNPNRWERLREIAALPDKSSNLRAALAQSLGRMNAPQAKELLRVIEATSRPSTTQTNSAASRPKGR